jgi:hypothetical protein
VKDKNSLKSDILKKWAMFMKKKKEESPLDKEKKKIQKRLVDKESLKQGELLD